MICAGFACGPSPAQPQEALVAASSGNELVAAQPAERVRIHHSRATVLLPFGIAQFATDQFDAGMIFATFETLTLGLAITSYALCPLTVIDTTDRDRGVSQPCPMRLPAFAASNPWFTALKATNIASWSVFGALLGGGLIHALLTLPPDQVVRRTAHRTQRRGLLRQFAIVPSVLTPIGVSVGFTF